MEKKLFRSAVVFLFAAVTCSSALAIAPLGPPTAGLEQGQKRIAFEYGYGKVDLEASGFKTSAFGSAHISGGSGSGTATVSDVESNAFLANIGYGATDNWEAYALLGMANVQIDKVGNAKELGADGDYGFGYGFGTKYTFRKEESLSWGAMFQMAWSNSDDSGTLTDDDFFGAEVELAKTDVEIDYYEIIIAVGPTYEMNEQLRIYGGPFFCMLDGEYDMKISAPDGESGMKISFDLEEDSQFGGYVGAEYDLAENAPLFVELQFTGGGWGLGVGIGWKF